MLVWSLGANIFGGLAGASSAAVGSSHRNFLCAVASAAIVMAMTVKVKEDTYDYDVGFKLWSSGFGVQVRIAKKRGND